MRGFDVIISAKYIADADGTNVAISVINDGVTSSIPLSGGNWLRAQLMDWVAAGGVIEPAATTQD